MKSGASFIGKVTRNKKVKDKKSQPMNKYTLIEVLPFTLKVLMHVFVNYRNNKRGNKQHKQKSIRPNIKT